MDLQKSIISTTKLGEGSNEKVALETAQRKDGPTKAVSIPVALAGPVCRTNLTPVTETGENIPSSAKVKGSGEQRSRLRISAKCEPACGEPLR